MNGLTLIFTSVWIASRDGEKSSIKMFTISFIFTVISLLKFILRIMDVELVELDISFIEHMLTIDDITFQHEENEYIVQQQAELNELNMRYAALESELRDLDELHDINVKLVELHARQNELQTKLFPLPVENSDDQPLHAIEASPIEDSSVEGTDTNQTEIVSSPDDDDNCSVITVSSSSTEPSQPLKKRGLKKRRRKEFYEVEKIVAKKVVGDTVFYQIKWLGFSSGFNEWVEETNLRCPKLLKKFKNC